MPITKQKGECREWRYELLGRWQNGTAQDDSVLFGLLAERQSTARTFSLFTTPFGNCCCLGIVAGVVKRAQDDSVFYWVFGYRCGSARQRSLGFLISPPLTKRRVTKTKQQAGRPPKKNAVILSPFYSRVAGTKWQAGRPAGIKREKDLAELLRYANNQAKRGMPRMAV